jgi:UDPglucose--hexose-1-phosphate uridylyltransferase
VVNDDYLGTWVFQNDFQALQNGDLPESINSDLFKAHGLQGECRVICYSDDHSKTMARFSAEQVTNVINCWIDQYGELAKKYEWVQIFENKGQMMGCSNPHPHGQIWATSPKPHQPTLKDKNQKNYWEKHKRSMLLDYVQKEIELDQRVVMETIFWCVVVPYWATWPFETMILPKFTVSSFDQLAKYEQAKEDLAQVLKGITVKYDNLFNCSFPYSMGWHGDNQEHWQLHAHFFPPLLRNASIKKHMVGFEMLCESQRDITAETAASMLRDQPLEHYLDK